ncbi:MAG: succinate dehydrogenase, hydrophobic membrane anchor protein [Neomegalonema sp.]|nr:succinate dehydrogenase, hydrophobic membrane anchor protein [Neomegalonema sp.]
MSERRMETPMRRVFGLGSASGGTEHWWGQRITSVALIPLSVLFVIPFIGLLGAADLAAVKAHFSQPFHAVIAILFIFTTALHLQQGLQVVIEDYVHSKFWRMFLLLTNTLGVTFLGVLGVFAIAKMAFAG